MIKIKNTLVSSTIEMSGNKEEVNFQFNDVTLKKQNNSKCYKAMNSEKNIGKEEKFNNLNCKDNECENDGHNNKVNYLYLILFIFISILKF